MSEQQPERSKGAGAGCIAAVILCFVMLPIFYLASTGPLILLAENNWIPLEWLMWLYFPIEWLAERSEVFKTLMILYIRLWKGDD